MARPFSSDEAKRLLQIHHDTLKMLREGEASENEYREKVKAAADAIVAQGVLNVLKEAPVEELGRSKRGLRVKALREHGYNTVADVAAASVHSLASVYGISEDTAYSIKGIANGMAAEARKGVKISLSSDNRTKEATALILALFQYRRSIPAADKCHALLTANAKKIKYAEEDLNAARGSVKWLFSSKAKKQKAVEAFDMLSALQGGDYGSQAEALFAELDAIERSRGSDAWQAFSENPIRFTNDLEYIDPSVLGNDDSVYGLPEDLAREIQEECFFPEGLLCDLRKYQIWGVKYALHQERILLGDEMGLGKTVQAIATMVSLRNTGGTHFMVVCPASVLANWCREIRKMSLLSVTKIHGTGRKSAFEAWLRTGGVAVTTYETTAYLGLPFDFKFKMLVVDEAHYIKNPEARRSENVRNISLHAERLMFMTGTALENKVDEMINLLRILQPDVARQVQGMAFMSAAPQFRKAVAPVYYRRKQEDVLTQLPKLIENEEWCYMGYEEEMAYERAVLSKNFAEARRVSWNVDDIRVSSKATRLVELVNEAESEGRKVIVFSFFLDTLRKVSMLLGSRCIGPINGSVAPQRRQEIIDEFDNAPAGSVLVAQIQSGGTGLNIQSASVVIICEPQLKPSIERQAIARAHRLGQHRNVLAYKLLCGDSIDERMLALLAEKQAEFDAFADKSVAAMQTPELDEKTLGGLINGEIDRINAKYKTSAE